MPPSPFDLVKGTAFGEYTASATPLTGGMINHVWRLVSRIDPARTVVVKYAGPELAAEPGVDFSTERMAFEARALALLGEEPASSCGGGGDLAQSIKLGKALAPTPGLRLPQLLHYDPAVPFIVMEDIGTLPDIHQWSVDRAMAGRYAELAVGLTTVCGRVGEWVARLHGFGFDHRTELEPLFTNHPARALVGKVVYDAVAAELIEHSTLVDRHQLASLVPRFRAETAPGGTAPRTLLFGDLWSGAVLVDGASHHVTMLDCEFADMGPVCNDIGHFVAHLLPLHFLCSADYDPNTDPCPAHIAAFLATYRATLAAEHPAAFDALISAGDAARLSSMFVGIEIAHDVLNGNWCRCAGPRKSPAGKKPLTCPCAATLLPFARDCMYNRATAVFHALD
ncbi:hypothetical protein H4R19_002899 [Coemansia spiralis]|nr:hypothetical protein H4R19_002899 [Coemansia spiralis]